MSVAWPLVSLGTLCSMVKGTSPTLKTLPGPYPLVVTAEFRRSADSWQIEGPAVCIPLVSSTGHGDAALHRVHYQEGKFALANLLVALIPKDAAICDANYLYHLLMAQKNSLLVPLMQGTANVSLKEKDIATVEIPLPPLVEQQHIVARVEELSAKIEEARVLRRQAIAEAEALSRSAVEAVYQGLAARFGQSTLSDTCTSITDGDHNTPQFSESGIKFIFVGNVSSGKLHFNNSKKVAETYFNSLKPHRVPARGDILYSAVGATLGIATVVDTDEPFCFQRHIAILKPNRKIVESRYVWHMLNSQTVFEKTWSSTTGTAQPTVPLRAIRELPLPLPTISEQHHIVSYLDDLLAKVYELKHLQTETAAELDAMLSSILDKAFKGEL